MAIIIAGSTLRLDAHGALASLEQDGERVAVNGALAALTYQTCDHADCERYVTEYCCTQDPWLLAEFAKSGLVGSGEIVCDESLHGLLKSFRRAA